MPGRGVKKRSHEKLTDANIQHVMGLLDAESPITKKEACSILNISYNTTRLKTIIEEFVEQKEYRDKRKAANRGVPARASEKISESIAHTWFHRMFVAGGSLQLTPRYL